MNQAGLTALLSESGQTLLAEVESWDPREHDFLRHFQQLEKRATADLARAALETAILRREARAKFGDASAQMYFTREAMQQATSAPIAVYRAQRFAGLNHVADLCCSIGADSLALADTGLTVLGLDHDPLRLALAQANCAGTSSTGRADFAQADLTQTLPFSQMDALFFDPARRRAGRRKFSVRDYSPPLSVIQGWSHFPEMAVKLSPGIDLDEIAGYDAELEFISLSGELKEAVLWFGGLRTAGVRATLLPGGHTLVGRRPGTGSGLISAPGVMSSATAQSAHYDESTPPVLLHPGAFLYEPDPAVIRAGLVRDLGERLNAGQLDETIAYLTSDTAVETPFARRWPIEDWLPFNLKKLRAYLRNLGVGRVTVKKRGSPLEPEWLIRALRLNGSEEKILVLTQLAGEPIVLVCGTR